MAKRRKAKSGTTIRRGSCRVVRGAVRICMGRDGKLRVTATAGRRKKRRTTKRKGRKGVRRSVGKKLKKPKSCKSKPRVRKGTCGCTLKSGKKKSLRIAYCRAPKRKGGRRKRR